MKKILLACAVSTVVMLPSLASAELSSTVSLVSDYTFNGVSQTDNSPALQASLDYGTDDFYVGTWASNVNFGDDGDDTNGDNESTDVEWDFYVGKYFQLSQAASVDTGIAYYTYHGQANRTDRTASDDYAYPEVYVKGGFSSGAGQTELNLWYSWDYFGYGGGHSVAMLAHSYDVAEGHTIRASIDQSTSMDKDSWVWNGDDASYVHYRLEYQTSYEGFDFVVAAEDTTIEEGYLADRADARIVAGVSYTFGL